MGYRLSKIYTRTGDDGTTGLGDGSRVKKDSPRILAIGSVDELNSQLGLICSEEIDSTTKEMLTEIQHRLFDIGGELSVPGYSVLNETSITWLEQQLDRMNDDLSPLEDFILPGGCRAAALCHVARSVCRRAERDCFSLGDKEEVSSLITRFLNRLSDLLFVLARYQNSINGQPDVLWQHQQENEH
jgi:cob(I)alamin adenosyltransferase